MLNGVAGAGQPRLGAEMPEGRLRGLALLEIREPVRDLADIVLSDANRAVVDDVLLDRARAGAGAH